MKQCDEKRRFDDRQQAMDALTGIINDRNYKKSKVKPTKVYHCEQCGGYHLFTEAKRRTLTKRVSKDIVSEAVFKTDRRLVIRNYSSKPL